MNWLSFQLMRIWIWISLIPFRILIWRAENLLYDEIEKLSQTIGKKEKESVIQNDQRD